MKPTPCDHRVWVSYPGKPPVAAVGKHYLFKIHACQKTALNVLCQLVSVGKALMLGRE